jgi:class 3 adenylate cyclase
VGERVERKVVTILFCDLVGFTATFDLADPEDVQDALAVYYARVVREIERYGGTAEKFIGDAVMAVWGAPIAREDDAERSVRAALDLVDAVRGLGTGIEIRAGIVTGEAAVSIGATNQGTVAGDMVNTASAARTGRLGELRRSSRNILAHSLKFPTLRKRKVFLHPPPRQRDGRSIGGIRWSSRDGAGPAKLATLVVDDCAQQCDQPG